MTDEFEEDLNQDTGKKQELETLMSTDLSKEARDTVEIRMTNINDDYLEETGCSMKEGSVNGGIFGLSSLALGTGAFSIPFYCTKLGLFWFIIFIILGSAAAYWTLTGLIKSSRRCKGLDYSPSVRALIGKAPSVLIDLIIVIYLIGVFVQYLVIIYSLIGRTFYEIFIDRDDYKTFDDYKAAKWDKASYKYPIMFGTTALVIPLCLLKDISKMRFSSMFGVCALMYSILVVVVQTPWFYKDYLDKYKEDDPKTHANWFDISKGFSSNLYFFTGVATVFFCYSCHPGAFPVYKTLKNKSEKNVNTVFFRSVCLDFVIYILVAICGFMTAPTNPKELIIYRDTVFENDIFMTIAKIALALDLFLSLPANFASYRCSFFIVFFGTDQIDDLRNWLVTLPTLLLSTLVGALYEKILSYISLFGGFCSSIMCYLIPGVLIIVTSNQKMNTLPNILRVIAITSLTTIGFMGGIQTIRKIINGSD